MKTEYNSRVNIFTNEYELLDGHKKRLIQQVADGSIIKRFEKTPVPTKPTDVVCPIFSNWSGLMAVPLIVHGAI